MEQEVQRDTMKKKKACVLSCMSIKRWWPLIPVTDPATTHTTTKPIDSNHPTTQIRPTPAHHHEPTPDHHHEPTRSYDLNEPR